MTRAAAGMRVGQQARQRQHQQLALTPRMRQSLRLLQLTALELRAEVDELLDANYMLEVEDEGGSALSAPIEWSGHGERDLTALADEQAAKAEISLRDHLLSQLDGARCSEREHLVGTVIIDAINEDGYLIDPEDELLATLARLNQPTTPEQLGAMLDRVRDFDPPGVGARNLAECLQLQLATLVEDNPFRMTALRIATDHLEALARHDHAALRAALDINDKELNGALALIRSLNPRPGAAYSTGNDIEYAIPELIARPAEEGTGETGWRVELHPGALPKLRINPLYADLTRRDLSTGSITARDPAVRQHLSEARWILHCMKSRSETLLRVGRAIVRRQAAFMEQGEAAMRPMILLDIADELGLHRSTVSRVTRRKYIETPRGVFELRHFFSARLATQNGNDASATAIRARLRTLIGDEDPAKPRSDQRLVADLEEAGFQVARRTVAKYREAMGIPSSTERRRAWRAQLDARGA